MTNPSPVVRFNLAASSTDEPLPYVGDVFLFGLIRQERTDPMQRKKQRIQKDIPEAAPNFVITSHNSINSVKLFFFCHLTTHKIMYIHCWDNGYKHELDVYVGIPIWWLYNPLVTIRSLCMNMHHEFKVNMKKNHYLVPGVKVLRQELKL